MWPSIARGRHHVRRGDKPNSLSSKPSTLQRSGPNKLKPLSLSGVWQYYKSTFHYQSTFDVLASNLCSWKDLGDLSFKGLVLEPWPHRDVFGIVSWCDERQDTFMSWNLEEMASRFNTLMDVSLVWESILLHLPPWHPSTSKLTFMHLSNFSTFLRCLLFINKLCLLTFSRGLQHHNFYESGECSISQLQEDICNGCNLLERIVHSILYTWNR